MGNQGYVFDQSREGERERLAVIESYVDAHSTARLEALGVAAGWRCLEVGAGGGSLARWMCRRVGREGSVLAIDLDPRFLDQVEEPNLDVCRLDVVRDELPRDAFDLVHARYVLEHVRERETALRQLVRAVRPGGFVVVTDAGGLPPQTARPSEVFDRVVSAFGEAAAANDWSFDWAPSLGERLRELGLADVCAESFRRYETDPSQGVTRIMSETLVLLREALVATGGVASEDVDAAIAMLRDPKCAILGFETWTAWGRRGDGAFGLPSASTSALGVM
jgi:SAM-dependent methyltransferase